MEKEDIRLTDVKRILIGNVPYEFLLEVAMRSVFIYLVFYLMVRWLGKRMNGLLTVTELIVMLTLGGVIAVPMLLPDRGLIQGLVVIACVFIFQQGISSLGFRFPAIEKASQGNALTLVEDGVMDLEKMGNARISHYQLFAKLREHKIYNLGAVERAYMEACGLFSIYSSQSPKPGLSLLPKEDEQLAGFQKEAEGVLACVNCGTSAQVDRTTNCPHCGRQEWVEAVI